MGPDVENINTAKEFQAIVSNENDLTKEMMSNGLCIFPNDEHLAALFIKHNGDIYWKGKKITGDDEFRKAVLNLSNVLTNGDSSTSRTQDPRYHIQNGKLIDSTTLEPIPTDEPVMIIRASDGVNVDDLATAVGSRSINNNDKASAFIYIVDKLEKFEKEHPERMRNN